MLCRVAPDYEHKWWNREVTLKCKSKCWLNPWTTHWTLALVKGIREPHEVKKKSFDLAGNRTHDLRIRSTVTLPTGLRGRTEKVSVRPRSSVGRLFLLIVVVPTRRQSAVFRYHLTTQSLTKQSIDILLPSSYQRDIRSFKRNRKSPISMLGQGLTTK